MWTKTNYENFEKGLNAILDNAKGVGEDELVELLVNYLESHCPGVNRKYATWAFKEHLVFDRGTIGDCVMEWAEELQNDIRWPVAYAYTVTGKLAVDYLENTTVIVVVVGRQNKILGHQVVHWSDFSHIEDDKECYVAFNQAIDDCAIGLGARSIFDFHCDGKLTKSVSVSHHPEQGADIFNERDYWDTTASLNQQDADEPAASMAPSEEQCPDDDFTRALENL